MHNENIFDERAQRILRHLKTDLRYGEQFLPRPFFIELTGSPSAGKTTTITELDKFFRRQGFRVLRPQEGAEVIRHIERTAPVYNIRTGLYALEILLDLSHSHQYDVVIFDRCVFDTYAWMMYWEEKGKLSAEERKLFQTFFLSDLWEDKIDAAYFFVCDPDVAMKRELRIALSQKLGETTNPATVKTLVERYRRAFAELSPSHPQLHLVDTTGLPEAGMIEKIATHIFDIFERTINAREKKAAQ